MSPLFLSSSYLVFEPLGTSITTGTISGARSPTETSCQGCMIAVYREHSRPEQTALFPRWPDARKVRARSSKIRSPDSSTSRKAHYRSMTQSREAAEANSFAEAFEASLNFKTPAQGELLRGQ